MPRRVVKRSKQFIAPHLFPAPLYQLRQENAHCVIISNRKLMRMLAHDCTSRLQIIFASARIRAEKSNPYRSVANASAASDANSKAALRQTIAVSLASAG